MTKRLRRKMTMEEKTGDPYYYARREERKAAVSVRNCQSPESLSPESPRGRAQGAGMTRDDLKRLAEAATPGPWTSDGADVQDRHRTVARIWGEAADAEFIAAANPAAILALLAEFEAMERERDEWRDRGDGGGRGTSRSSKG